MIDGRKLAAEGLGTGFLLAIIVGSGIMGERLADGNDAIALLANSTATGAGLVVLIWCLVPYPARISIPPSLWLRPYPDRYR